MLPPRKRSVLLGPLALGVALVAPWAGASEGSSILVRLAGSTPLAGAAVRVKSGRYTDVVVRGDLGAREVRIASLPPGRYVVSIDLSGFDPPALELDLAPRETVRLTAHLAAAGTSRSMLEIAERLTPSLGVSFDEVELDRLPSGRDPWALLETADAASILDRIDAGGLYSGEPGRLGLHGASWSDISYRLGDQDVTDPVRGGAPLLFVPTDALAALDRASGAAPVDAAFSAPTVSLMPRRPTATWRGSARAFGTPSGLESSRAAVAPSSARYASWNDASLVASGPLIRDRLGILGAFRATRSKRLERDDPAVLQSDVRSGLLQGVFRAAARDELRGLVAWQGIERPASSRPRFALTGVRETAKARHAQVTWERRSDAGGRVRMSAGYLRHAFDPPAEPSSFATIERLLAGPIPELFGPQMSIRRADLSLVVEPSLGRSGRHFWRFGAEFERDWVEANPTGTSLAVAERVAGLPARVWNYAFVGPQSRWRAYRLGMHGSDRIRLGERWVMDAGLRIEDQRGTAAGGGSIDWLPLSPRLGTRFRLSRALLLHAGARLDHPRLPLSLLGFGDSAWLQGVTYLWLDRNEDGLFQTRERGPVIAQLGPGGTAASIDRGLESPRSLETTAGFELRLGARLRVGMSGIYRRTSGLVESVNVGVPLSSYRIRFVPDPAVDIDGAADDRLLALYDRDPASFGLDRYLLTNATDHDVLHQGAELFVLRTGERLRFRLGATASRTSGSGANRGYRANENDPGLMGELFDHPNADSFRTGRLFYDRAYTIKALLLAQPVRDLFLGAVARYQDGQPFARLVLAADLAQGPEVVQAVRRGDHRFTYTLTLDARLEKVFALGKGRLSAVLEVFNLLDQRNEVEEDTLSGPGFRRVTATQPPRALRLGVGLAF